MCSTFAAGAVLACSTADMNETPEKEPLPANGERLFSFRRLRPGLRRLVASLGALWPAGVGSRIVLGRGVDQGNNFGLERLDPVRPLDPLGAVPLRHIGGVVAVVVLARHAHRSREAFGSHFLQARGRNVE